ncbi:hypothetical protein [Azospirillum argentinense]
MIPVKLRRRAAWSSAPEIPGGEKAARQTYISEADSGS